MKHTSGPWSIDQLYGLVIGPEGGEQQICAIHGSEHVSRSQAQANARLIAAAPDLFNALSAVLSILPKDRYLEFSRENDLILTAKSAIAKAMGE